MVSLARSIAARYDAAVTSDENRRHWANADDLSAVAANSAAVRRTLRRRARYEYANNCYCNGMIRTLAYHAIGTGPTLQIETGDKATSNRIKRAWRSWSREVGLARKLRTMREARARDGEAFALMTTNDKLLSPITLDVRLVEADQISSPTLGLIESQNQIDGIRYDSAGNPVQYDLLRQHPGDSYLLANDDADAVSAEKVIHWFREDRPGQRRGIPEITPALPLYAVLRRYTLATLGSAEIAAMFSLFLKTSSSAFDPAELESWAALEVNRNALTTLPDGWDVSQLKSEQPSTSYDAFVQAVIREIARCLDMPFNVAAGDSSRYNYASGRLDHQTYFRAIDVDREHLEEVCLDRLLAAWLDEAVLIPDLLDRSAPISQWDHDWTWEPYEHVDPAKEATAVTTLLQYGLTSFPTELAKAGKDWEREQERQAESLGISVGEYRTLLRAKLLGESMASEPQEPQDRQEQQQAEAISQLKLEMDELRDQIEEMAHAS